MKSINIDGNITMEQEGDDGKGNVAGNCDSKEFLLSGRTKGKRITLIQFPKNLMSFGSS